MEGADHRIVQSDRRVDVDALLHLGGGALGEGNSQDLVRLRRTRRDQVDDAGREHVGLPCSRTSDYQQWSKTVFDREALLWLQPLEDVRTRLTESEAQLLGH